MANYPCDPTPHLPPGTNVIPPCIHRRRRTMHVFGGAPLLICDDWAIVILEPPSNPDHFGADAAFIYDFLDHQGYAVKTISRSAMGASLVQFNNTYARDTAIQNSSYFVGDSVLHIIPQNRGLNHRACTFTHDVWIMIVNYPQEAWLVEKVRECVSKFGYFLVWNRDMSNRARILVKIRVPDMLNIPITLVLSENTSDEGTVHS
jgi:hypothetical protein